MFASQLSNHLLAAGHEVVIVSLHPGQAALPFRGELVRLDRKPGRRLFDVDGWRRLARKIKEINPDLIQANAGDTLKFAVFSKLLFRWRTPIVFRNANKVSDFIDSSLKLRFNRFLVSQVAGVVSVSELCRLDFIRTYNIENLRITTVSIGIDLREVPGPTSNDLDPIFARGKVLVNVASFVPEKNHIGLLRIVQTLVERGEHIQVLLIGDGKLKSQLIEYAKLMNLTGTVHFCGYRNDVLSIVARAQAFVLPSNIEGLPAVILEAMYCRVPVVAYNVGGISEVVKSHETGWLVPPGDEQGFVDAVQEILHVPDVHSITVKAFRQVTEGYDNRLIAERFAEFYSLLIHGEGRKLIPGIPK